jgi:hypothetical protein
MTIFAGADAQARTCWHVRAQNHVKGQRVAPSRNVAEDLDLETAIGWCASFATLPQQVFNPRLVAQRYPPTLDPMRFGETAEELRFRVEASAKSVDRVLVQRFPITVSLAPAQKDPGRSSAQCALIPTQR